MRVRLQNNDVIKRSLTQRSSLLESYMAEEMSKIYAYWKQVSKGQKRLPPAARGIRLTIGSLMTRPRNVADRASREKERWEFRNNVEAEFNLRPRPTSVLPRGRKFLFECADRQRAR